jgi:hypothetical protein
MSDFLIILGMLLATVVSVIGVAKNNTVIVFVGAFLSLPVLFYLNNTISFRGIIFLPILHLGAVVALNKEKKSIAWLFLLPMILLTLLFLYLGILFGLLMEKGVVY